MNGNYLIFILICVSIYTIFSYIMMVLKGLVYIIHYHFLPQVIRSNNLDLFYQANKRKAK